MVTLLSATSVGLVGAARATVGAKDAARAMDASRVPNLLRIAIGFPFMCDSFRSVIVVALHLPE